MHLTVYLQVCIRIVMPVESMIVSLTGHVNTAKNKEINHENLFSVYSGTKNVWTYIAIARIVFVDL